MSTPRAVLADALTATLPPELNVEPYARRLDAITRQTLMLRLDEVTPGTTQGRRPYSFTLIVMSPITEPGAADDDLDALLEDVLFAIEQTRDVSWSKASRGVWIDETTPAYEVTLEVPFTYTAQETAP